LAALRFDPGGLFGGPRVALVRAPVRAVGGQCLEVVPASLGKVGAENVCQSRPSGSCAPVSAPRA
jgi:hypothetical protein